MNDDTSKLFERVAKKMGWAVKEGLHREEKELLKVTSKSRHFATSGHRAMDPASLLLQAELSDSEEDPEKENYCFQGNDSKSRALTDSSDDDFDKFLTARTKSKANPATPKMCTSAKKDSSKVLVVSSDDDGSFETFLQHMKTPNTKPRAISESGSEDSLKNFIVDDHSSDDDFIQPRVSLKVPKKSTTPAAQRSQRRPLSQWDSPVFISDDDDDNIVVKSTWRTRHSRPKALPEAHKNKGLPNDKNKDSPSLPSPPFHSSFLPPSHETPSPKRTFSAPSKLDELSSSEEEFTSLLERLKKKKPLTSTSFLPKNTQECSKEAPVEVPSTKGSATPASKSAGETPLNLKTPGKSTFLKPVVNQTEPTHGPTSRVMQCKTPGCFLQLLSNPGFTYGRNFKQNKEDLTSKLYQLYNASVFDSKLPANLSVKWNKKMRKTAGYCITGQERGGGSRYARIELSEKVCDSADRLRDTLIHEMCHAATWLINGVRDGHGKFWKFYARKSTVVHPELPMVSRCHSYDIKYKFQYQCTRCKNTIGRHSKSLDTQRFVCALCTGQLVLLTPSKPRAPTPFASFVKQHYGTVRQELAGQSHADVMRKLSADFASMTKLS